MNVYNFETPSRQSLKGIIVVLALSLFKTIKQSIALVLILVVGYIKDSELVSNHYLKFILGFAILLIVLLIISILKYITFKFYADEHYFFLNQGILNKEQITIAKSKIQNVYIKQNFVQQLINVVALSIETAGDDKAEIEIHALSKQKAQALKDALLKNGSNEINEVTTTTDVYFKASMKQLLLEGISQNHFKSFMIVFGVLLGGYYEFKDFINSLNIESDLKKYFQYDELDVVKFVVFNVFLFITVLAIAFSFSLIKTVIINFNLKVVEITNGLEISKGLFNKISLNLKKKRIQNITLKTNRFKQFLGLYNLKFAQTMGNKKEKERLSIIGINKLEANSLIYKFYAGVFKNLNKQKPEKYFIRVKAFRWCFTILLLNIPILFFATPYTLFLNIPIILFVILHIKLSYKKAHFSIDDKYFVKGSGGFFETITDILELHKVHSVELEQSIFQKRRGIASVVIYSGAQGLTIPHITFKNARRIVDYILFKVESQHKDWM